MSIRRLVPVLLATVAVAAAAYAFHRWSRASQLPAGVIQVNGRFEGDEIVVAAKNAGRVQAICAREGDTVEGGQTLLRLDDAQAQARLAQAAHGEAVARAQLRAAESALEMLELEVPLSIRAAEDGVMRARAALAKAEAAEEQAGRDAKRFAALANRGSLGIQKSEAADLAWATAIADAFGGRASLSQAERQLGQALLGLQRITTERHHVAAVSAQLEQARAVVSDAKSVLADLTIMAPASGVIMTRLAENGEVVSAGAPLFNIVDLNRLYVKVYVPESQIGKVRLGLPARLYVDAFPNHPFTAMVRYISSRAEFTPKEVQSPDERVKLVYAVKLYLDANPNQCLTPGLPADAIIRYDEEAPWSPPHH
jgi:HlyD family secretion protein